MCSLEEHKYGGPIVSPINFCYKSWRKTQRRKTAQTWDLASLLIYRYFIISEILGFRHSKVLISVFDGLIVKTTNNLHLLPLPWQNRKKWSVQAKALKVYHRDQYKVSTLNVLEMLLKFCFVLFLVPLLEPAYGGTSTLFLVFRVHVVFEGIYFFFCICDNRPWHLLRCRLSVLFGWT